MNSKIDIRRQLLGMRKQVKAVEKQIASREAKKQALRIVDWVDVHKVHIYTARADWHEIETKQLGAKLKEQYPSIVIETSAISSDAPIPTTQFDVIVVPVLGFDDLGYRIGLGRGWYDRFLSTQTKAYKVGLAYSWGRQVVIPHDAHDVALDVIIAV